VPDAQSGVVVVALVSAIPSLRWARSACVPRLPAILGRFRMTSGRPAGPLAGALALSVILIAPAEGQEQPNRQSEQLVGPVRVVTGRSWDARREGDGLIEADGGKPIDTVTFDTAGRVMTRDIISTYGFAVGRETHRYQGSRLVDTVLRDDKGAVIERRTYTYGPGVDPIAMAVSGADTRGYEARYLRVAGGRLERITYLVKGVETGHTAFTYQQGPNPAVIAFFLPTGAKAVAPVGPCLGAHRITYRYAGGRVTELILFEPDGAQKRRSTFAYDAAGNMTSEARSEPFGETRMTHAYEYDRQGNWITRTTTVARTEGVGGRAPAPSIIITRRTLTYD
jgi:hypothetical protein